MLRRYMERQEHALHRFNDNRQSLPFDWGPEHLGLPTGGDPAGAVRAYALNALADSSAFFSCEPARDYQFDGEILSFPSAIETPYVVNNTVWGRFFPAGKDLGVIVLPQWNCSWEGQVGLCRALQKVGVSALRLSLPYHHRRNLEHLERAEYIVSANVGRTLSAVRQAVLDTRRAADWLLETGHRRIALVGTSLGSCVGFLAFAHDKRFSGGAFLHVSGFFADVVWDGLSTRHVRRGLEGFIGLDELRPLWEPISPFRYIERLRESPRPTLMLSGRYDLSFPSDFTKKTFDEFRRLGIPASMNWLPCGHYTMGKFPFREIVGFRVVRFMRGLAREGENGRG